MVNLSGGVPREIPEPIAQKKLVAKKIPTLDAPALRLEAIWQTPVRYSFVHTIRRWDIPPEMAGKVRTDELRRYDVYGQAGRWRFDTITAPDQKNSVTDVVVATNDRRYRAVQRRGEQGFAITDAKDQDRMLGESARTIAGLCEAAFMLPTRLDVADILLGPNYNIKVVPDPVLADAGSGPTPVECEFESVAKTAIGGKVTRLKFETGRIVFRPDFNWAIDRFELHANTSLSYTGRVEYQRIAGLDLPTVPKRVELDSTETKSTLKTRDVLDAVLVRPGPIEDSVFDPEQFQPQPGRLKPRPGG